MCKQWFSLTAEASSAPCAKLCNTNHTSLFPPFLSLLRIAVAKLDLNRRWRGDRRALGALQLLVLTVAIYVLFFFSHTEYICALMLVTLTAHDRL